MDVQGEDEPEVMGMTEDRRPKMIAEDFIRRGDQR
jgi:hypothetical protein